MHNTCNENTVVFSIWVSFHGTFSNDMRLGEEGGYFAKT